MKTVIINGSARKNGNTSQIIEILQPLLNADSVYLSDKKIGHFDYDFKHQDDDFMPTFKKLLAYDCWIFATPIYWYAMSGAMKTFFDRITDCLKIEKEMGRKLRGKSMAALCCGSEETPVEGFFVPFVRSAEYLGMHYLGDIHTFVEIDHPDASVVQDVTTFGQQLIRTFQQ